MIKKINENNEVYSVKQYLLNGKTITIKVKNHDFYKENVYSFMYREEINLEKFKVQNYSLAKEVDFFEDMDTIFSHMAGKELVLQNMWDAYVNLIENHLNKFGRLIWTDLESYLDSIMYAMSAISIDSGMAKISDSDGQRIRKDFRNSTLQVFGDYVWITKIVDSLNPLSPSNLVRYREL